VLADLNHALELRPQNAYLLYNRGCIHAKRNNYRQAIEDFTAALNQEPNMAEAYFNRGICHMKSEAPQQAETDLSKAGELGLYAAYSLLKRNLHSTP
jgi:Tfp pilus assembly protein PilF